MAHAAPIVAFERRLEAFTAKKIVAEGVMKQAAVAAVLRARGEDVDVLFIRRAQHPKDPWSGHMAFPGGRVDPGDVSTLSAALRETREELGLDLSATAVKLGELSHLTAMAHGRPMPLIVTPFVFALVGVDDVKLSPNHEVEEAIWVPWSHLFDQAHRASFAYKIAGVNVDLPSIPYEGRIIWGLTLRMVDELVSIMK